MQTTNPLLSPPTPDHLAGLQPTCLRLAFRLDSPRSRPYSIQLSVPSLHISVQTEQTVFSTFSTALTVPSCPPDTTITLRLLNKHNILATLPLTYARLLSSLKHAIDTPHALIHIFAAPHAPELATLRASLRISSRGILNAARARFSTIGDCVVSLSYLCRGSWIQFYRSGTPKERQAGGELLSYGPEQGADTQIRIEAFRMTNTRFNLVASVDVTLQHLLKIGRQIPLLNNFSAKGYVKIRDAQVEKHTAQIALDVFLYARPFETGMPLVETRPSEHPIAPPSVVMTPSNFKRAANTYDFRAPGFRSFVRGLLGMRRRKKLHQAALMIVQTIEKDAKEGRTDGKPQLPVSS
ncbi:unnamed protein product [Agarophyton chilense]|eukprot:gb/GEZJ01001790.1/.p1 GENE.gb/GEZJ01001790.1/~~gb/GEZJ01001790.1/.p1  ORF type:complete len:373 (+),score=36.87 gb/GEZJ01001790.1/:66-1121(+)